MKSIFGYRPSYILLRPWKLFEEIYWEIKYALQRVFRGWDDKVVWSIDYYLAENMPIWLSVLKMNKHGIPMRFFTNKALTRAEDVSRKEHDVAREEWNMVLDKIIEGFKAAKWINDYAFDEDYTEKMAYADFNEGMDLFKEHFFNLWD